MYMIMFCIYTKLIIDPTIWSIIKNHKVNRSSDMEDICDGEAYKTHKAFVAHPANITLTCNTDGVSIYRSSKTSIWPIWVAINELPPSLRFVILNVILM